MPRTMLILDGALGFVHAEAGGGQLSMSDCTRQQNSTDVY